MRPIHFTPLLVPALALAAAVSPPMPANGLGDTLPEAKLEDFAQTRAASLEDYSGRAVLIEFFAYW